MKRIDGFSKLTKAEKIAWLCDTYLTEVENVTALFERYQNADAELQKLHDKFIENTVSNYYLSFAAAPSLVINGRTYTVPMTTEESSVVATASRAAKYWQTYGGLHTEVPDTQKTGYVHSFFYGEKADLTASFVRVQPLMLANTQLITSSMEKRGGGIASLTLEDRTEALAHYYQLSATFETLGVMRTNFTNSCLESFVDTFRDKADRDPLLQGKYEVVMSILSNYVPNCVARAEVFCPVKDLKIAHSEGETAARKFVQVLAIANVDVYRATTHNKGIMNDIDAVTPATGNDLRAIEAGAHAYTARTGRYKSLSDARIAGDTFHSALELSLALGIAGGLTSLHPLTKTALAILEKPNARELMQIVACVGLAQNSSAVSSLVSLGTQKGHMEMHLSNILNQLGASEDEKKVLTTYFKDKMVTYSEVRREFEKLRG